MHSSVHHLMASEISSITLKVPWVNLVYAVLLEWCSSAIHAEMNLSNTNKIGPYHLQLERQVPALVLGCSGAGNRKDCSPLSPGAAPPDSLGARFGTSLIAAYSSFTCVVSRHQTLVDHKWPTVDCGLQIETFAKHKHTKWLESIKTDFWSTPKLASSWSNHHIMARTPWENYSVKQTALHHDR